METLVAISVVIGLYFLPTIVAALRQKSNAGAIGVFNFFLGWTFIGWVVALTWAFMIEDQRANS